MTGGGHLSSARVLLGARPAAGQARVLGRASAWAAGWSAGAGAVAGPWRGGAQARGVGPEAVFSISSPNLSLSNFC